MITTERRFYWYAQLRLITVLLIVWFTIAVGCGIVLVRPLNQFYLGTIPLGFWCAHYGTLLVTPLIIFGYALGIARLNKRYAIAE